MKTSSRLAAAAAACVLGLGWAGTARADTLLANFPADWNAARSDGIGAGGGAVTAGSAQDAPQQGHRDTIGTGNWQYGRYAPLSDPGVQPLVWDEGVQVYDTANNGTYDIPIVGPDWAHPQGSGSAPNYSLRIWQSGVAGQVHIAGTIQVPDPVSDGVQLAIVKNSDVNAPLFQQVVTPANGTVNYAVDTTVAPGDFINFAVGPGGPGSSQNNDTTLITGSITLVPEPGSALGLGGLVGLLALRRKR